eukprot:CAMPEP_0172170100 /NCGR_PEP_ID=MMETSP1050-20130122/11076_1 /TAXON_ID=233186 /ORGANISM="Cryptomonas curvata, Strain CCAP979/52" /LENGTH=83 /DNA_ID=CAMNT_0012841237 /DNA_START=165 /DNA_END=413 /DNA_ORIENTATION=-
MGDIVEEDYEEIFEEEVESEGETYPKQTNDSAAAKSEAAAPNSQPPDEALAKTESQPIQPVPHQAPPRESVSADTEQAHPNSA